MTQLLISDADAASQSIRRTVDVLAPLLTQKSLYRFNESLWPPSLLQFGTVPCRPSPALVAWNIVAMWLTGVVTNNLSIKATFRDAAQWFFGNNEPASITDILSAPEVRTAEQALPFTINAESCHELLPYMLDPHGPGSRLSVMRNPTTQAARAQKRAEGAFYTPVDVATYMVKGCLNSLQDDSLPIIFDPACGTGIFLKAALRELIQRHSDKDAYSLAFECLFGTDIAPWPLDATAFVVLAELLLRDARRDNLPIKLWSRLRLNLRRIDTLQLEPFSHIDEVNDHSWRVSLSQLFPAMKHEPTLIVGNPPYADLGNPPYVDDVVRSFKTLQVKPVSTAELYVVFLEQMIRLSSREQCAGSLVLPLSIASNTGPQFTAARQLIQATPGQWRFAFFDREPQALFGEDVKTRNTVLFWNRDSSSTESALATGPLRRWRGHSRQAMFDDIQFTQIHCNIRSGIPKLDGHRQATAMQILSARWNRLAHAVHSVSRMALIDTMSADDNIVFVGTTAYNFLNVFLRPPRAALDEYRRLSDNPLHAIHCATPDVALAVLAILSSHLAYWWWHAHGDGFHVLKRFILDFPFGHDVLNNRSMEYLRNTGEALWSSIHLHPIISLNRGRVSLAYSPIPHTTARRSVDHLLVSEAGIDPRFVDEVQRFTQHTIAATV